VSLPLRTSIAATFAVALQLALSAVFLGRLQQVVIWMLVCPPSIGATAAVVIVARTLGRRLPGAGFGPIALGVLSWHIATLAGGGLMALFGLVGAFPYLLFASLLGTIPVGAAVALLTNGWEPRSVLGIAGAALAVGMLSLLPLDRLVLIVGSTLMWTAAIAWFVGDWIDRS
jgi:hypothetical protein